MSARSARPDEGPPYRHLLDAAPQAYVLFDPDFFIRYANPSYFALTGTTPKDVINRYAFDAFPENPSDAQAHSAERVLASLTSVCETREPDDMGIVKYDIPIRDEPGHFREGHWTLRHYPVMDGDRLIGVLQHVEDVTQQHLTSKETAIKLRIANRISGVGYGEFDIRTGEARVSAELAEIFGLPPEEGTHPSNEFFSMVHHEDRALVESSLAKAIETRGLLDVDYRIQLPDGAVKWVNTRGEIVLESGEPARFVGASIDFTRSKQREDDLRKTIGERDWLLRQKEALLADVQHRVKNSLQLVASILRIEAGAARGEDTRDHLTRAAMRVQAISSVHELVYRASDISHVEMGDYLPQLVDSLGHALDAEKRGIRLETRATNLTLPTDMAISLALLINELVSNAVKHGFNDREQGIVRVVVSTSPDRLHLEVSDNGAGEIDAAGERGLGKTIMNGLVDQMGGTMRAETTADGYRVDVKTPLPT